MRAYQITVTDPKTNNVIQQWTSSPTGLNVELDFFSFGTAQGGMSTLTIEGVSLQDLQQAPKYYLMNVDVTAGFTAGFPLAKPAQYGTIWQGFINQSFGNWIGTEMTLDFVMGNYAERLGHFIFNWKAGSSFQDAMQTMLSIAFPQYEVVFNIAANYALSHDVMHAVAGFTNMGRFIHSITRSIKKPGVSMSVTNQTVLVYDNSNPPPPKQIAFNELIGQPTWVERNTMQFVTPMRADIQVGTTIQMPQGIGAPGTVTTTGAPSLGGGPLKYQPTFQGTFSVVSVRYVGNFRDPAGSSWATVFNANANTLG